MEPSTNRCRSSMKHIRESFFSAVIYPAIRRKICPICLGELEFRHAAVLSPCMHGYCEDCIRKWSNLRRTCPLCNAKFDSWFRKINLYSRSFREERLRTLDGCDRMNHGVPYSRSNIRRINRSTGMESSSRTRQLPWRRSFGRPGAVSSHVIAQRKLEWRASLYHKRLQAVPSCSRNLVRMNGMKEGITHRIEPWIHRELQAILGDPDPSVVVHLATSLFVSSLEEKTVGWLSTGIVAEDNFLAPLRPFLHDKTNLFWHELRCFAGSSLAMEAYDSVTEYTQLE